MLDHYRPAETLDVQHLSVRSFLLGICNAVKYQPEGSRKVHRYTRSRRGAYTEIGRVDSIDGSEVFHG